MQAVMSGAAVLIPSTDQQYVRIELPDGTVRTLPIATVSRSSVLSTALATGDSSSEVVCPHLESWIEFNDFSLRSRDKQADEGLIKAVEAANYLADAQVLQEAALLLSRRVLAAGMPQHRLTKILGALSEDAVRIVLSAQQLPLSFLLSHLPTPYHPDALRTFYPSAEAQHSLEFLGYHWTAETTLSAMHALPALTTVTSLKIAMRADLNKHTRGELSSSVLRAVASMPALKALTVSELLISNRRATEDLLDESTGGELQLQTLLFFNCGIATNVRGTLSEFIRSMPALVSLEFNASRAHELFGGLVATITPPLCALVHLESLQVSGQSLSEEEVQHMAVCLSSLREPPLRNLHLPFNSIQAGGAQALAQALLMLTNLEKLDLTRNTIASAGAEAIAQALPSCSKLVLLDLWANGIGDLGVQALSRTLNRLPSLMFLDLCLNRISDSGAVALAGALENHTALRSLNLDNNLVSNEGALALARALMGLKTFGTLFLCRNRLSDEGKVAVEAILTSAVRVQSYSVRGSQSLTETFL